MPNTFSNKNQNRKTSSTKGQLAPQPPAEAGGYETPFMGYRDSTLPTGVGEEMKEMDLENKANLLLRLEECHPATGLSVHGHDKKIGRRGMVFELIDPNVLEDVVPLRRVGGSICLCQRTSDDEDLAGDFPPNLCTDLERKIERY